MRKTSVPERAEIFSQSIFKCSDPDSLLPVMIETVDAWSRWVSGMPAYADTPTAEGIPGTTVKRIPAFLRA